MYYILRTDINKFWGENNEWVSNKKDAQCSKYQSLMFETFLILKDKFNLTTMEVVFIGE